MQTNILQSAQQLLKHVLKWLVSLRSGLRCGTRALDKIKTRRSTVEFGTMFDWDSTLRIQVKAGQTLHGRINVVYYFLPFMVQRGPQAR